MSKHAKANARQHPGKLHTPGGQTYLENLRRLAPTELTEKAIEQVEADDAARRSESGPEH